MSSGRHNRNRIAVLIPGLATFLLLGVAVWRNHGLPMEQRGVPWLGILLAAFVTAAANVGTSFQIKLASAQVVTGGWFLTGLLENHLDHFTPPVGMMMASTAIVLCASFAAATLGAKLLSACGFGTSDAGGINNS